MAAVARPWLPGGARSSVTAPAAGAAGASGGNRCFRPCIHMMLPVEQTAIQGSSALSLAACG